MHSRRRLAVAALVTAVVFPSVALNTGQAGELLLSLFVFAAAYAFGRLSDTRQAYVRAVEDRARQLEVTRRIEAEQAVARERARIARETHDVLSHAVSLMIVQAEAGPVAIRTAPERAEAAFDAISETGRDAMIQLRRMLGLLRDTSAPPDAPAPGATTPTPTPTPTPTRNASPSPSSRPSPRIPLPPSDQSGSTRRRRADDHRRPARTGGQGVRATPQKATSAVVSGGRLGSGRQAALDTTPGGTRSRPSKKEPISCGDRRW